MSEQIEMDHLAPLEEVWQKFDQTTEFRTTANQ
jgi:hypothetical protein